VVGVALSLQPDTFHLTFGRADGVRSAGVRIMQAAIVRVVGTHTWYSGHARLC
jgi:hypothetical protein